MDAVTEIKLHHARLRALKGQLEALLSDVADIAQADAIQNVVSQLTTMAFEDGTEFGAAREKVAQQYR